MIGQIVFGAPMLLLGLLAVGVPLLLHLIWRMRAQQLPFSTVRFLQWAMIRTVRRRRFQNVALLPLRCSAFALSAFALPLPSYRVSVIGRLAPTS